MSVRNEQRWRRLGGAILALVTAGTTIAVLPTTAGAALPPARSTSALCSGVTPGSSGFGDIAGDTHRASIECIKAYGIANGTSATTFSPGTAVNRGQMASFIARTIDTANALEKVDLPALPASAADRFNDDTGSPHEISINRLAAMGIVNGRSATGFAPNQPVSRAQMATFINNAQRFLSRGSAPFVGAEDYFTDDNGNLHEGNINAVAGAGVAQGVSAGRYVPDGPVTRSQMTTFLARYLATLHANGVIDTSTGEEEPPPGPPSNAELTVTPVDAARIVAAVEPSDDDERTYTATGLANDQLYRVSLFQADLLTVDPGPVIAFTEDGNSGFALEGVVGGTIVSVNGVDVGPAQSLGGLRPTGGSITFVVDAVSFGTLVPIIHTDQGGTQSRLNLNDQDRPSEPFGFGGALQTIPQNASTGFLGNDYLVIMSDEAEDLIVGFHDDTQRSYRYDANDRFYINHDDDPRNELTITEFEALLNFGDHLDADTSYNANPALQSVFVLQNTSPPPPTPRVTAVGERTATITIDDLLPGATAKVYLAPRDKGFSDATLKTSTPVDGNPNEPAFQVQLTDLTPGLNYEYYVTQVIDGEESDPLYFEARPETHLRPVPASAPALVGAAMADGRTVVLLHWSEEVNPVPGSAGRVRITCTQPGLLPPLLPLPPIFTTPTYNQVGVAIAEVPDDVDTLAVTMPSAVPTDTCRVSVGTDVAEDIDGVTNGGPVERTL